MRTLLVSVAIALSGMSIGAQEYIGNASFAFKDRVTTVVRGATHQFSWTGVVLRVPTLGVYFDCSILTVDSTSVSGRIDIGNGNVSFRGPVSSRDVVYHPGNRVHRRNRTVGELPRGEILVTAYFPANRLSPGDTVGISATFQAHGAGDVVFCPRFTVVNAEGFPISVENYVQEYPKSSNILNFQGHFCQGTPLHIARESRPVE